LQQRDGEIQRQGATWATGVFTRFPGRKTSKKYRKRREKKEMTVKVS